MAGNLLQPDDSSIVLGDWGTSRLRLFLWRCGGIQERCEGAGIGALRVPALESLHASLVPWRHEHTIGRIYLCGMAGSRNGILEVPYASTPLTASEWVSRAGVLTSRGLTITVAAGVAGSNVLGAPDVMRGEETQVFGAVRLEPALGNGRQVLLLPGTHSKWVQLEQGKLTGFTTFITGELFALLREHSMLLRAARADPASAPATAQESDGFAAGIERARAADGALSALLFEARAAQLTLGRSASWAAGFLSGVLLGSEIAAALRALPEAHRPCIIGEPGLTARYRHALALHGVAAVELDGNQCALTGLQWLAGVAAGKD